MDGIVLHIDVLDNGTVKVKQFADETKKAFDEMKKGPEQARAPMASIRESWVGLTAKVALATAAFYAAKRIIYDTAKEMASFGSEIERISETMGMSINQFQEWRYVAKMTDVEFQSLTMGLRMLSQNMLDISRGTGEAKDSFIRLGISVTNSDGSLKSINQMIPEIAEKLSKIQNPTEKLALTMEIFGSRSGEAFTALLRQGGPAIETMIKEFNDLGFAIDEKWIQKLAESESSFKKLSFAGEKLKASFAPMVEEIAASMERMASYTSSFQKIADIMEEMAVVSKVISGQPWYMKMLPGIGDIIAIKETYAELDKLYQERAEKARANFMSSTPSNWIADWVKAYKPGRGEGEKVDLFGMTEADHKRSQDNLEWYSNWVTDEFVPALKGFSMGEAAAAEGILTQWIKTDIENADKEIKEFWEKQLSDPKRYARSIREAQQFETLYGFPAMEAEAKAFFANMVKPVSDLESIWMNLSKNISTAWDFNVTGILRGTENIGDAFKNMADGMVDTFVSSISKMITQWFLFGSITGEKKSGGGFLYGGSWGGLLGTLLGAEGGIFPSWTPVKTFQHGGLVDRPTLGVFGEAGAEAVIPLKNGKIPIEGQGGSPTYLIYISSPDPMSWTDFVRRNPAPFIELVEKNLKKRGAMHRSIRSYT